MTVFLVLSQLVWVLPFLSDSLVISERTFRFPSRSKLDTSVYSQEYK